MAMHNMNVDFQYQYQLHVWEVLVLGWCSDIVYAGANENRDRRNETAHSASGVCSVVVI